MAVRNPASYLQQRTDHTANNDRLTLAALLSGVAGSFAGNSGVHPGFGTACAVAENGTPNMTVNVGAGIVAIFGSENSLQGPYIVVLDALENKAIAAAHATLPRIDIVVVKVEDAFYSGAVNSASLVVVTGTAAASPAVPTAPANSITLAEVSVPAADTAITNSQITDRRKFLAAAGGILRCTSTTRPANPPVSQPIFETDTTLLQVWTGSSWIQPGRQAPVFAESSTDQTNFSNTTAVPGSPVVGLTFVAPASGKVFVSVSGYINQTQDTKATVLGWDLRNGGTIGSGTIVMDIDSERALIAGNAVNAGAVAQEGGTHRHLVTGLTPGSTYNARTLHLVTAGGTGNAFYRSICVEPV